MESKCDGAHLHFLGSDIYKRFTSQGHMWFTGNPNHTSF